MGTVNFPKRVCPLCGKQNTFLLMELTAERIAALNSTYDLEQFKNDLGQSENHLKYSQCTSCGMVYCDREWPKEILERVYERTIDHQRSYKRVFRLEKRLYVVRQWERILRILAIHGLESIQGLRVFDFGCGWGDALDVIQGPGLEVIGFELDKIKIQETLKRGYRILQDPAQLKDLEPVDVFIMNAVVEHVQNVPDIMRLAYSKLKPGGVLVLSTMDFRSRFIRKNMKMIRQEKPLLSQHFNPVEHVNIYDFFTVKKTISSYGFRWFASEWVMRWAGLPLPYLQNSRRWISLLNHIEYFCSKILQDGERSITVYAVKT